MEYEWDEAKRQDNAMKHGVDFSAIEAFEWQTAVTESNLRDDELRYVAIGYIDGRLHVAIYTLRGNNRRIISLRRANPREVRNYVRSREQT
jgi:uncharacterized DUF497 family protein